MARVMLVAERTEDLHPVETLLAGDGRVGVVDRCPAGRIAADGMAGARVRPDAVVVDVSAGLDTWEALPRLREALPDAAIVAVSALPDPVTLLHVIDAGADAYLDRAAPADVVSVLAGLLADRAVIAA